MKNAELNRNSCPPASGTSRMIIYALSLIVGCGVHLACADTERAYPVVDTGQMECYSADGEVITAPASGQPFYGQDAQYEGVQPSCRDNGDGTVTDLNTGLMWQQVPEARGKSWQEAVDYCNALELGGYTDWRMPSLKELFSISDFSVGWPYLDTTYFSIAGQSVSKDEQYWSDNAYVGVTVEGGSDAAFGVNHGTGHIKAYPAAVSGPMGKYVRAVRGDAYGINQFTDNGDGTITDEATGLMWAQADNGEGIDWADALAYAESSTLAGYSDWRLPNVKELQSIVDYSRSPTATDPDCVGPAIDTVFSCTPIKNEASSDDYPYYWSSTSARFQAGGSFYYAWYVAFGMAVNGEGEDYHGAGAVRFVTKEEGGAAGEGGERYYNYVRLVRDTTSSGVTLNSAAAISSLRDFDGDGKTDIGCYYAPDGWWYVYKSGSSTLWVEQYGYGNTYPVAEDFDGDGFCDYGTYEPVNGKWNIMCSTEGAWSTQFGYSGTVPVTGDFDGDGKMDFGCYYAPGGNWYIFKSSTKSLWTIRFGYAGTVPVVADFDGDGTDDFGCYYAPDGSWYIFSSGDQQMWTTSFGYTGTVPIVGDFDGDGRDDFGCYYAENGSWYIFKSSTSSLWVTSFGYQGTTPLVGDYDGDGIADFGCYYPATGHWYLFMSASQNLVVTQFGYEGTVAL